MAFSKTTAVYCENHQYKRQCTVSISTAREFRRFVPAVRNPVSVEHKAFLPCYFFIFFMDVFLTV